jgi:hypothetical protein
MTDEHSTPSVLTLSIVTSTLLCVFMLAMSWGLGLVFDEHVAGLLAASTTWSLAIILSLQDHISLPRRRTFLGGSGFGLVMIVFNVAPLLVGTKSHLLIPIAVAVLIPPMLAIHALLERIVFTDGERREIKSSASQRTRVV